RFVMDHRIFKIPGMNFLFRTARAIPIAPAKEDPAMLERAYAEIDQALKNGEIIGLFPEGRLTPDGSIQLFKSGIEKILAANPVPVIPLAVRGLWGSMWSRIDSQLRRARLPRRFRAEIELLAAAPIAPEHATAAALEEKVRAMRGDQA
ncbi:1-acyl-sn-glycerol-3-phosphate acyltransferase, partial [uncultured Nevskia sp.]|uniref:1-acyl-sn-glycerol-3-phosphate acyltransferase n=1 Tax=uncultured Nevskia sp. TaxID=228950 RepID=UPI0025EC7E83